MVVSAGRSGVVTSVQRLVALISSIRGSNGGASVGSIVRCTVVVSSNWRRESARGWNSTDFRVTVASGTVGFAVALPELDARALGVAISGARTKCLLLLVVAAETHLNKGRDEEEQGSDDSDSKASSVQSTDGAEAGRIGDLVTLSVAAESLPRVCWSVAERSTDIARAAAGTVAGENGDCDHGTTAEDIEEYAQQGEDGLSTNEAGQEDSEYGIQNDTTRQAGDGLLPNGDGYIAVSLNGKEVAVDAKNDTSAAKLEGVEGCRAKLQRSTTKGHGEGCRKERRKTGKGS